MGVVDKPDDHRNTVTAGDFAQDAVCIEPIDEDMLKKVAGTTGGRYYLATDTAALIGAYKEINALETTEIDLGDYYEFKEAFMPYLILGALLTVLSVIVRRSAFEVVP